MIGNQIVVACLDSTSVFINSLRLCLFSNFVFLSFISNEYRMNL